MKDTIIWLFPVLFMLHDFEEIILVQAWGKRYKIKLERQKPKKLVFADCNNTAAFSIGVAIEFFIISLVSLISSLMGSFNFWYGLFLAFTIHLFGHCIVIFFYRLYVPGVITSILFLPCCLYILYNTMKIFEFTVINVVFYGSAGVVIMLLMLIGLHKCMGVFERIITRFEHQA